MRFLKPIHDAADCLRRFARSIAHRIGLPRANGFCGAIFVCAICEKKYSAISKAGSRRGGTLFAADCLRRFARPIAHRIGLPRANGFRGAIYPCAVCEKKYSAISEAGSRRGGTLFAADCSRRFARPSARRIGLPRTNDFRGAIFACATHEKRRGAILETGLRTRDAVRGDSLIRSRAESDCRVPTAFAAQYLPAQLMKTARGDS